MAQSVWMAIPSRHEYRLVDVTGLPNAASDDLSNVDDIARADSGPKAIIAAVRAAGEKQRRITSICRFNMDILLIVD